MDGVAGGVGNPADAEVGGGARLDDGAGLGEAVKDEVLPAPDLLQAGGGVIPRHLTAGSASKQLLPLGLQDAGGDLDSEFPQLHLMAQIVVNLVESL